jgi:hypothetical protein
MLKGKQKKLDKNKDGKISGEDFKMMKAKIGKIATEEKYSTVEFGKTYHPITQSQMSNNIRKNFEGDKKFAGSKELDDAHEKIKKNLSDKNVRPSEILKLDKEYKARKERAIKTVQKDLSSRPEMKELRKKTKGTVTDTGSTYSKGGAARTSGMGLQDENLIPGKVQKAFLGLMAVKKAKDKGAKGAEFLSPAAMLKRMLSKKKGGVAKGEMMKAKYGKMIKANKGKDIDIIEAITNKSLIGQGLLTQMKSAAKSAKKKNMGGEMKSTKGYGAARTSGMGLQDESLKSGQNYEITKGGDYIKDLI